jgi:hypothetical protein
MANMRRRPSRSASEPDLSSSAAKRERVRIDGPLQVGEARASRSRVAYQCVHCSAALKQFASGHATLLAGGAEHQQRFLSTRHSLLLASTRCQSIMSDKVARILASIPVLIVLSSGWLVETDGGKSDWGMTARLAGRPRAPNWPPFSVLVGPDCGLPTSGCRRTALPVDVGLSAFGANGSPTCPESASRGTPGWSKAGTYLPLSNSSMRWHAHRCSSRRTSTPAKPGGPNRSAARNACRRRPDPIPITSSRPERQFL